MTHMTSRCLVAAMVGLGLLAAAPVDAQERVRLWLPIVQQPGSAELAQVAMVGGRSSAVASADWGYAYLGRGAALAVLEANPAQPREVASVPMPEVVTDIIVDAGRAYVQAGKVLIYDVRDPVAPRRLGEVPVYGLLALDGKRLYGAGYLDLTAYEVTDPANPVFLGSWSYPTNLSGDVSASALAVDGGAAYLASMGSLLVVDVRDMGRARLVSVDPIWASAVAAVPGWLYAAAGSELRVYRRADPWTLTLTTTANLCAVGMAGYSGPLIVYGGRGAAVCTDYRTSWLQLLDLTNPGRPRALGWLAVATRNDFPFTQPGLDLDGSTVFLAGGEHNLQVISTADPWAPEVVAWVDAVKSAYRVSVAGRFAYVSSSEPPRMVLAVVDLTDPHRPVTRGTLQLPGFAAFLLIEGDRLIAVGTRSDASNYFLVIDVADPDTPRVLGQLDLPVWPAGAAVEGDVVAVAGHLGQLVLVDVSEPTAPRQLSALQVGEDAGELALVGGRAYVTVPRTAPVASGGVVVVDVARPERPVALGEVVTGGEPRRVALGGGQLFVGEDQGLVSTLDIHGAGLPRLVGRAHLGGHPYLPLLAAHGDVLAAGRDAVNLYDMTTPQWPVPLASAPTTWYEGLTMTSDLVLVADADRGLRVMRWGR